MPSWSSLASDASPASLRSIWRWLSVTGALIGIGSSGCQQFDVLPMIVIKCGDGVIEEPSPYACDDGNEVLGDGCDGCYIERGWRCTGEPSICYRTCGNGQIDPPLGPDDLEELCDDGNDLPGDGCDEECQIEPGWTCAGAPSHCTQT